MTTLFGPIPRSLWLVLATVLLGALLRPQGVEQEPPAQLDEPLARSLSRALTRAPRLAGTRGSKSGAEWVASRLLEFGWRVEFDRREVLLSFPRHVEFAARTPAGALFHRTASFDPRATDPGDVPLYSAWSASGTVSAGVIDVGRGLRADFDAARARGEEVAGKIALCRYGGAYRGVKAALAQEFGCVGVLLFSDPEEDGDARGETWPEGPWKPGDEAQRGSIGSLTRVPGDPSTPGWPSPPPGVASPRPRATGAELAEALPGIPCLPIGANDALALIEAGPEVRVTLSVDVPRELFEIINVIARLEGSEDELVLAGNHRDAWVRGAHDAGSGTVSLLLAARALGERARAGWKPRASIVLGFWDAEEHGLIGSTEWGEAHAHELRAQGVAYVNADAVVSGLSLGISATPGLRASVRSALKRVSLPTLEKSEDGAKKGSDLWSQLAGGNDEPLWGLPGSGSDYTVFLHHLGLPAIDLSFHGASGGQYHTAFDDFAHMDRFLDPGWHGHELAGRTLSALLAELAERGKASFDAQEAARSLARIVAREGARDDSPLGSERANRIAQELQRLALTLADRQLEGAAFYAALEAPEGLADRPWYRNQLWAPGIETGYAAELLPELRGEGAGERVDRLCAQLAALRERVEAQAQ